MINNPGTGTDISFSAPFARSSPLEMLNISINFMQSFSLVLFIDINWPIELKHLFSWLEVFFFDIEFAGVGDWPSILTGLAISPILIYSFDHGLFYERADFGRVERIVSQRKAWWIHAIKMGAILVLELLVTTILSVVIAKDGSGSEGQQIAEFFLGTVSLVMICTMGCMIHWFYLRGLYRTCSRVNEDFGSKRKSSDFTVFLFFYTISYLSGINACLKMIMKGSREKSNLIIGSGALIAAGYTFVPLGKLLHCAYLTKKSLEVRGGSSEEFKESMMAVYEKARKAMDLNRNQRQLHRGASSDLEAARTSSAPPLHLFDGELEKNEPKSPFGNAIIQVGVVGILLGSFEEPFWWCLLLMDEK